MPGSEILAAQAARQLDDLTAVIAHACAQISAISPAAVVQRTKPDASPVTSADEASEGALLHGLARVLRGVPVISEETPQAGKNFDPRDSFVVIDPLDGTREFLAGTDEFTVNLAIITHGAPIAGIIAAPKRGQIWRGVVGVKAERLRLMPDGGDRAQTIQTRSWPDGGAVAAVSRSHMDASTDSLLVALGPVTRIPSGSAIKFCQVAEGTVDIYPRLATTCEWDVGAGHALVVAAGGIVTGPRGAALAYGRVKENFRVPAFIAWGDARKAAAAGF